MPAIESEARTPDPGEPGLTGPELDEVETYFVAWWAAARAMAAARPLAGTDWKDRLPPPPIALLQRAALLHPSGKVRRDALTILDHDANVASTEVFRAALADPSAKVRTLALHGLSCERCRNEVLCAADVVPAMIRLLQDDPSPKVRQAAVTPLLLLADRDDRVLPTLARAAAADPDPLVRRAAHAAHCGDWRNVASRKTMRRQDRRAVARGATRSPSRAGESDAVLTPDHVHPTRGSSRS